MRLLNINTFRLETFYDARSTPPYVILSHTWGFHEVSFDNIIHTGYTPGRCNKIDGCCTEARRWDVSYVWIDTCCIDKGSSAELSEAINSMFVWYRRAVVCLAYLSDVPGREEETEKQNDEKIERTQVKESGERIQLGTKCDTQSFRTSQTQVLWEWDAETDRAFREARWFTRGWTLQELLAPVQVLFFNSSWQCLGIRAKIKRALYDQMPYKKFTSSSFRSLSHILEEITTIDVLYLVGAWDIERASIAQRMSWATNRRTTREEDLAYCLLGIFGINMPLLYGEGSKAFLRLQDEIIKMSNDQTLLACSPRVQLLDDDKILASRAATTGLVDSSLFASAPSDFADARALVPFRTSIVATNGGRGGSRPKKHSGTQHYMMTNKGLFANFQVLELTPTGDICLVRLACGFDSVFASNYPGGLVDNKFEPTRPVAILLYRDPEEANEFWRVPHRPVYVFERCFDMVLNNDVYLSRSPREFCRVRISTKIQIPSDNTDDRLDMSSNISVFPPLWRGLFNESRLILFPDGDPTYFGPYIVWACIPMPKILGGSRCLVVKIVLLIDVIGANGKIGFDYILSKLSATVAVVDREEEFWGMIAEAGRGEKGTRPANRVLHRSRSAMELLMSRVNSQTPAGLKPGTSTRSKPVKPQFGDQVVFNGHILRPWVFWIKTDTETQKTAYGLKITQSQASLPLPQEDTRRKSKTATSQRKETVFSWNLSFRSA